MMLCCWPSLAAQVHVSVSQGQPCSWGARAACSSQQQAAQGECADSQVEHCEVCSPAHLSMCIWYANMSSCSLLATTLLPLRLACSLLNSNMKQGPESVGQLALSKVCPAELHSRSQRFPQLSGRLSAAYCVLAVSALPVVKFTAGQAWVGY